MCAKRRVLSIEGRSLPSDGLHETEGVGLSLFSDNPCCPRAAAMHQVVIVLWRACVGCTIVGTGKSSRGDAFPFVSFCLTGPTPFLDAIVWCCSSEADYCMDLQAGRSVNTDVDWLFFFPEENSLLRRWEVLLAICWLLCLLDPTTPWSNSMGRGGIEMSS